MNARARIPAITPFSRRLLAAVAEEPGERTAAQLAHDLKLDKKKVAAALHQLSRRGLLQPRLYRLHPWAKLSPGLENDTERRIFHTLKKCPHTKQDLADALMVYVTDGGFNRALRRLHSWGSISKPAEVDPSDAGLWLLGVTAAPPPPAGGG